MAKIQINKKGKLVVPVSKKQLTEREKKGLHGAKTREQIFREEVEKLNGDLNTHRLGFSTYLTKMKALEKRYGGD